MYSKKNVEKYVKRIAKEHGVTQKVARQILVYGMKNITKLIEAGEDIRLQHFGNFYFDKKAYAAYLKKLKTSEKASNNKPHVGQLKNQE